MGFKFVVLWTDVALWVLFAAIAGYGIRVARPVKKGQSLCWDDVVMDTSTRAYALRKELEGGFVPGGGLG